MQDDAFKAKLSEKAEYFEKNLKLYIPNDEVYNATVIESMDYSLSAGGKRLRPVMMQAAFELFAGDDYTMDDGNAAGKALLSFMAAIEMIHTYSLVHDDLPAMDNDEFRRGKLTTWKKYGDGMGVLSGDALLNLAFETMLECACRAFAEQGKTDLPERCIKAAKVIAVKAGFSGMIGGQCADLEGEGKGDALTTETLLYIHEHKTGCLIEASLIAGGILGGAQEEDIKALEKIGSDIGIAFQIRDDILDVYGDSSELGKNTGSDEAAGKVTYVTKNGLEKSEKEVERLSREACEMLDALPGDKSFLLALINSLINRTK